MTVRAAAEQFGVPKSTLHRKLKGESVYCKMGPKTVLTEQEEQEIVDTILYAAEQGFPLTKSQLVDTVQRYLNNANRKSKFPNNRPQKKWFKAFMKRHPNISIRKAQKLSTKRASITEEELRDWFNKLKNYLLKKDLLDIDASRVFNLDETNFPLIPDKELVLAETGSQSVHKIVSSSEKTCVTVLTLASASGEICNPLILYRLKTAPRKSILEKVPSGWAVGKTENGWMTSESFYKYMTEVFYKWLVKKEYEFPVLVYADGHSSHFSLELIEFCKTHLIVLTGLYPNSTHVIQPLDVALFKLLKHYYALENIQYKIENNLVEFPLKLFAPVLELAWKKYDYSQSIKNGFEACGLYPFNPDAVNYQFINKKKRKNLDITNALTHQENPTELSGEQKVVDMLKKYLSPEVKQAFEAARFESNWTGDISYTALFDCWKKIKNSCSNDFIF